MTDQTKLLLEEITHLLPDATEDQLRRALDVLRPSDSTPPPLVGLSDFDEFLGRRFGTVDKYATSRVWLMLTRVDDPLVALYDELGIRRSIQDVGRPTSVTAHLWRMPVSSIVACARALTPYGEDMPLRVALSSVTGTEKTLLLVWAATFTSS